MSNPTNAIQDSPAGVAALRQVLLQGWNDIGQKIVKLGEAFPAERYGYRPAPGVRTFAEQLRHVAFWNLYVVKTVRGEEFDSSPNELPEKTYATKTQIIEILKRTIDDAAAELSKPESVPALDLWVPFTAHSCEHYGQLVVYCRLNGVVPPA